VEVVAALQALQRAHGGAAAGLKQLRAASSLRAQKSALALRAQGPRAHPREATLTLSAVRCKLEQAGGRGEGAGGNKLRRGQLQPKKYVHVGFINRLEEHRPGFPGLVQIFPSVVRTDAPKGGVRACAFSLLFR